MRSSMPPIARPPRCSRGGSRSSCSSRTAAASECARCRPVPARGRAAEAVEVRAEPRRAGDGRRGPAVLGHHQPARVDGGRCRHGAAGRGARWPTSSSCSSIRPRCTTRPCPARSCPKRCAATVRSLRDRDGARFVDELAPRDVVSRAMAATMEAQGVDHLWLDATGLERFSTRFPTIAASLASIGLDPERDWLPIAPAAHHLSGGVVTDLWGATALRRAVGGGRGGLHGRARGQPPGLQLAARRHGLRARLAERISAGAAGPRGERRVAGRARASSPSTGSAPPCSPPTRPPCRSARSTQAGADVPKLRDTLQRAMTRGAGVVRSAESLAGARAVVEEIAAVLGIHAGSAAEGELANLLQLADALLRRGAGPHREPGRPRAARVPRDRPRLAPPARARCARCRPRRLGEGA